MRYCIVLVATIAIVVSTAQAGLFRRGCCHRHRGSCYMPPSMSVIPNGPSYYRSSPPSSCGPGGCRVMHDDAGDCAHFDESELVYLDELAQAPKKDQGPTEKEQNFGVDWDKIEDHKMSLNGRAITCEQAFERIGSQVPDDKNKLRLVVIGTDAENDPVRSAWAGADQSLRGRIVPWFVNPDHWSLKDTTSGDLRFKVDGHPTIYLLAPDGHSMHRQDGFTGGQDLEAIRKGLKAYDAKKDPDLRKPQPDDKSNPVIPLLPGITAKINGQMLAIGVIIAAVVLIVLRSR